MLAAEARRGTGDAGQQRNWLNKAAAAPPPGPQAQHQQLQHWAHQSPGAAAPWRCRLRSRPGSGRGRRRRCAGRSGGGPSRWRPPARQGGQQARWLRQLAARTASCKDHRGPLQRSPGSEARPTEQLAGAGCPTPLLARKRLPACPEQQYHPPPHTPQQHTPGSGTAGPPGCPAASWPRTGRRQASARRRWSRCRWGGGLPPPPRESRCDPRQPGRAR